MNKKSKLPNEKPTAKMISVWLLLGMVIVMLWTFNMSDNSSSVKNFDIKKLMNATVDDSLVEIQLTSDESGGKDWYIVSGKIKNPLYGKEGAANAKEKTLDFTFSGRITESAYNKLTDPNSAWKVIEKPAGSYWKNLLSSVLPILVLVFLAYWLFSRQMKAGTKGAMSFGKSRARLLGADKDRTTFDDVAGCDESKEEVAEIVDFLKNPKKFNDIGARIPKGVLMVGPPGTGKTLLARAIAGEANVPFYSISGSDFVEMFVGVGAARVRDMFDQARKSAPCLVFIDEIDAVGRQRGTGMGGSHDEREQTLNSLLVEMDGFDGHEGIIIIAATNRPDVLDAALLRPGRFDRQVVIDLPDVIGREEILKVHSKKLKYDNTVDLKKVAQMTPGCSGADLANLLNESAITAARRNSKNISMEDINTARDKIFFGRERRKLMDPAEKKLTAFHEAGHALIQCLLDDGSLPIHKVTIIPRGQSLGSTMFTPTKDTHCESKKSLLNHICTSLGGRVAEEIALSDITNGASGDIKSATKLAKKMVCDWGMSDLGPISYNENQEHIFLGKEISRSENISERTAELIDNQVKKIIDSQLERARKLVLDNKALLEKIAQALLERETIDGAEVMAIVKGLPKTATESAVAQSEAGAANADSNVQAQQPKA
ncbi:MAG: ATP-dependent zinc metalloprotease FtsH [Opitutales bacterium]|nr:ATP-dependent zinc metalloprotease FtsH [Opitutales bacterium]